VGRQLADTRLLNSAAEEIADIKDAAAARILYHLTRSGVPFLVGGSLALTRYTGLARNTKDVDLFLEERTLPLLLNELLTLGLEAWVPYPHWLAKAKNETISLDIIFGSGNGLSVVDVEWFDHSTETDFYGMPMRVVPAEELLWSKAFIMERERYDGADVAHLLRACGKIFDWDRLERRFGDHLLVLLSHVLLFYYTYSDAAEFLPPSLLPRLRERAEELMARRSPEKICYGTILSRQQFLPDLELLNYADGRVTSGTMTADEVAHWTSMIEHHEFDLPPSQR
jgi:hypothetical protein